MSSRSRPSTCSRHDRRPVRAAVALRPGSTPFDSTTIGPSFGRTIANSAVIAIIASLLVISAYVALRFEWKFAVPVLIALMHDLLITAGVYALTGREVTTSTVAALLTILGYSLYDTIIVFDRVRENIPRMPRAAFSQIVNRSMSEVLTRSIATTSCTLMPIIALLLFGGSTLQDFAFALLIGVASGAYSSIFIASPVLTHWKEREAVYRHRRDRIEADLGTVPAYAAAGADVEPARDRDRGRAGRLTDARPGDRLRGRVRADEARPRARGGASPARRTSTLTKRPAHRPAREPRAASADAVGPQPAPARRRKPAGAAGARRRRRRGRRSGNGFPAAPPTRPRTRAWPAPRSRTGPQASPRNRRHGRRR